MAAPVPRYWPDVIPYAWPRDSAVWLIAWNRGIICSTPCHPTSVAAPAAAAAGSMVAISSFAVMMAKWTGVHHRFTNPMIVEASCPAVPAGNMSPPPKLAYDPAVHRPRPRYPPPPPPPAAPPAAAAAAGPHPPLPPALRCAAAFAAAAAAAA